MDTETIVLLLGGVLVALGLTAWVSFRAGRAAQPPHPNPLAVFEMLENLHTRLCEMDRLLSDHHREFAEEANAARQLIDTRLDEAVELLAQREEEASAPKVRVHAAGA